jgi:triphosphoribosyl-dephospho-CoA synthetase
MIAVSAGREEMANLHRAWHERRNPGASQSLGQSCGAIARQQ